MPQGFWDQVVVFIKFEVCLEVLIQAFVRAMPRSCCRGLDKQVTVKRRDREDTRGIVLAQPLFDISHNQIPELHLVIVQTIPLMQHVLQAIRAADLRIPLTEGRLLPILLRFSRLQFELEQVERKPYLLTVELQCMCLQHIVLSVCIEACVFKHLNDYLPLSIKQRLHALIGVLFVSATEERPSSDCYLI